MREALRERSIGELIEQSLALVFKNLWRLFLIQLIFGLLLLALALTFGLALVAGAVAKSTAILAITFVALLVGFLILSPLPGGATFIAISDSFTGRRHSAVDCYRAVLPFIARLLFLSLAWSFIVFSPVAIPIVLGFLFLPFFVLVLPGLIAMLVLMMAYYVAYQALLLEDLPIGKAMRRSARLTRGYRWRLFAFTICLYVISSAFWMAGNLIQAAMSLAAPRSIVASVVAIGLPLVFNVIAGMLMSCAQVAVYFDLRVRKDAYHLDQLAEVVDRIAPSQPAP